MDSVQVEVVAKEVVPPTGEASLQITSVPPENQLTEEGTFELEAEFTDTQGEVQQEQPISWAIVEGNEFVELDSTTGEIRGLGEGTATVQATTIYEGKPVPSDVIVISVLPQQEQSTAKIEITNPPRYNNMTEGDTHTLGYRYTDKEGEEHTQGVLPVPEWKIRKGDGEILGVDQKGKLTAIGNGTAMVILEGPEKTKDSLEIQVYYKTELHITNIPEGNQLRVGDPHDLSYIFVDSHGGTYTEKEDAITVTWSEDDKIYSRGR